MKTILSKLPWFLVIFFFLFACGNPNLTQVASSSSMSEPTSVTTLTQTELPSTQSPIPSPTYLPTWTPRVTPLPPYTLKHILFNYFKVGSHSSFVSFYTEFGDSKLVLYDDGQMIILGKWEGIYRYYQKTSSESEIKQFFSKLEAFGFYKLESNQQHDPTDKLYNFGNQYSRVFDGLWYCVYVNLSEERNLCVHQQQRQFVVPEMENILQFVDQYQPQGLAIYSPDRILLSIHAGRDPDVNDLPEKAIAWPDHLPSIKTDDFKIMFFQDADAKEIFALFNNTVTFEVFSQNGIEYTVLVEVVLPHMKITNEYQ